MADSRCISVVVVDGDYSALRKFGFPLPALASMQEAGVHLRDACWDIKKSLDPPPNDAHHPLCADGDVSLGEATPRVDSSHDQAQVIETLNRDSIEPAVTKLSLSDVHNDSHDEVYTTKR